MLSIRSSSTSVSHRCADLAESATQESFKQEIDITPNSSVKRVACHQRHQCDFFGGGDEI